MKQKYLLTDILLRILVFETAVFIGASANLIALQSPWGQSGTNEVHANAESRAVSTTGGGGRMHGSDVGAGTSSLTPRGRFVERSPVTGTFRVLSKPRARYTNEAREFGIQGTVRLRVTFKGDRTIGEIRPITTLPFGLTEKAVAAAKKIRFVPETREGKPVDVKKTVVYSFILY